MATPTKMTVAEIEKLINELPSGATLIDKLGMLAAKNREFYEDAMTSSIFKSQGPAGALGGLPGAKQARPMAPMDVLKGRLRINGFPFEHISHHINDKMAVLFIVKSDKIVTLEDDPHLFPSDNLVTQLRMLME